jgi:hypothetical protein
MKKLTLLITSNIFNVNTLNILFEGHLMVAFFVSGCNRIVTLAMIGLDQTQYGTHTMLRSKPSLMHKKTKNLIACQPLLGH